MAFAAQGQQTVHDSSLESVRRPVVTVFPHGLHPGSDVIHGFAQDARGFMYVGNGWGVLEFDGSTWRLIQTPGAARDITSLAADTTGRIWVGGTAAIGYLEVDAFGTTRYHSLLDDVPENFNVSSVSSVRIHEGVPVFSATGGLLVWENDSFRAIPTRDALPPALPFREKLLFPTQYGTLRYDGGSLTLDDRYEEFGSSVRAVLPTSGGEFLIGTAEGAFFKAQPMGLDSGEGDTGQRPESLTTFETEADALLAERRLEGGQRLSDGTYALLMEAGGIVIIREDGSLVTRVDRSTSIVTDDLASAVFEDRDGNLWVDFASVIGKINLSEPLNLVARMPADIRDMVRYDGRIVVGHSGGFSYLDGSEVVRGERPVQPRSFVETAHGLLFLSDARLYHWEEGRLRELGPRPRCLSASAIRDDLVFMCLGTGIGTARYDEQQRTWVRGPDIPDVDEALDWIKEGAHGALWGILRRGGVIRLDAPSADGKRGQQTWTMEEDLAIDIFYPFLNEGRLWFLSDHGVVSFNPQGPPHFVPDTSFGEPWTNYERPAIDIVRVDANHLLIRLRAGSVVVDTNVPASEQPLAVLPQTSTIEWAFAEESDKGIHLWGFRGTDVYRYDVSDVRLHKPASAPIIKQVVIGDSAYVPVERWKDGHMDLSERQSSLTFAFASTSFSRHPGVLDAADSGVTYRHRLLPLSPQWSDWTATNDVAFTRLPTGDYVFEVQARTDNGVPSASNVVAFTISPPWYATPWARLAMIMALVAAAVWGSTRVVRERNRRLQLQSLELERTVAARTREVEAQKETLEQQAQQLAELDRVKSRFFANISHELRTPLTLTLGPVEAALDEKYGPLSERAQQAFQRARRNGLRMSRLVEQMLDLARVESGLESMAVQRADIGAFVASITALFESHAVSHDISLSFEGPAAPVVMGFDPDKVEKIVVNLLSNAIKFTPSGGTVTVSLATTSDGMIEIVVTDTGIGIPEDQHEAVFHRFQHFEGPLRSEHGNQGVGIGLSLVREFAEMHGGKASVASVPGRGSSFRVTLVSQQGSEDTRDVAVRSDWVSVEIEDPDRTESHAPRQEAEDSSSSDPVLLVVDDSADMRAYIREELEDQYTVHEADDGESGYHRAVDLVPDVIISDVMMPGWSGFELNRRLKEDRRTSHIPVVLLTARTDDEARIEGIESGADAYLGKPFSPRELKAWIQRLRERRMELQQSIRQSAPGHTFSDISQLDREFLEAFNRALTEGMSDPDFTMDRLASELALSRRQLYRKVGALLDESPSSLLRVRRLEEARRLMSEVGLAVGEAADRVGFQSVSAFRRAFKKQFGSVPSKDTDGS